MAGTARPTVLRSCHFRVGQAAPAIFAAFQIHILVCQTYSGGRRKVAWMEPFDFTQDRLREIQESAFVPDSTSLHLGYIPEGLRLKGYSHLCLQPIAFSLVLLTTEC
jgi:hypothetical protein